MMSYLHRTTGLELWLWGALDATALIPEPKEEQVIDREYQTREVDGAVILLSYCSRFWYYLSRVSSKVSTTTYHHIRPSMVESRIHPILELEHKYLLSCSSTA